jgi:hypothetical protein
MPDPFLFEEKLIEMKNKTLIYTVMLGVCSAGLYFLLWLLAEPIMEYSRQGRWYFLIPVAIAFLFSLVHGAFTGYFWDVLGVKAKAKK